MELGAANSVSNGDIRVPLVPPPGTSPLHDPVAKVSGGTVNATPSASSSTNSARGGIRFHSDVFERRERMATGLPDNIEDQVALVGGHGTAAARWARCALSRRAKFAVSGLLSLVVAVALALTIYFVTRPPRAAAAPNAFAASCTVFCHGDLLATVQAAQIWNDSKTFVDMPLTADPEDVLAAFHAQFPDPSTATQEQLAAFVSNFFLTAGSDTEPWVPSDYTPLPPQLTTIANLTLQNFSLGLNDLWLQLSRRIKDDVATYQQRYSLIHQPYPLIVPGGRFVESYYWDSYWVIQGLLRCGMTATAQGVALNLVHMLDTFGFVPNGGRVYYAMPGRSQPPLLGMMVREIYRATGNASFVAAVFPSLQREYQWWMTQGEYGHAVLINGPVNGSVVGSSSTSSAAAAATTSYVLNRYVTAQLTPRPESWLEDVHTAAAAGFNVSDPGAQILYAEIAAGAETGWDFSARWFADGENITTSDTSRVIPVELNSILYANELILGEFADMLAAYAGASVPSATAAAASAASASVAVGITPVMGALPGSSDECSLAAAALEAAQAAALSVAYGGTGGSAGSLRAAAAAAGGAEATGASVSGDELDEDLSAALAASAAASAADAAVSAAAERLDLCRRLLSFPVCTTQQTAPAAGASVSTGAAAGSSSTTAPTTGSCASKLAATLPPAGDAYRTAAAARAAAIEALLWDDAAQQWTDLRVVSPDSSLHGALARGAEIEASGAASASSSSNSGSKTAPPAASASASGTVAHETQPLSATAPGAHVHPAISHYFASASSSAGLTFGVNVARANLTSVSNFAPLWTGAYNTSDATRVAAVLAALDRSGLLEPAGLSSTMAQTEQQWDFPNGWAPLQSMLIVGLNATGVPAAQAAAKDLARRWVLTNLVAWELTGYMHEKYDIRAIGATGSGGEYVPQVGFGWTNGLALDLLVRYNFATLD